MHSLGGSLRIRLTHAEHCRVAHTLWIAHAHLMDAWYNTPRIAFLSAEPESGKSRCLEMTELLTPNPVLSMNVSPAYIYRKISAVPDALPTILFDEIDTVFGAKAGVNEELRGADQCRSSSQRDGRTLCD